MNSPLQDKLHAEIERVQSARRVWLDRTLAKLLFDGIKRNEIEITCNHDQTKTTIIVRGVPTYSYTIMVRGIEK